MTVTAEILQDCFTVLKIEDALKRLANNTSLFEKLLDKFAASYTNAAMDMQNLVVSGKLEEAVRMAHTLKGLAATMGAEELAESCLNLEAACNSPVIDSRGITRTLGAFTRSMQEVNNALTAGLTKLKSIKENA